MNPSTSLKNFPVGAAVLALGITLAGVFVYCGLKAISGRDRIVSVRGLSEREVKANKVTWPISYQLTGNDLQAIYAEINEKNEVIKKFLAAGGIKTDEISVNAPQITDNFVSGYRDKDNVSDRYSVTNVIVVASKQVDVVRGLIPRMGELLTQGIATSEDGYVQYEFTELNSIKPTMIEEATQNAREAAEKFAKDSQSDLGKIKDATQGYFEISDRDQYTPYIKTVRVVTSVDFFLES